MPAGIHLKGPYSRIKMIVVRNIKSQLNIKVQDLLLLNMFAVDIS